MKRLSKYIVLSALAVVMPASAQTTIDFESTDGYSRLGVYDTWEESPFRTGAIASPERYVGVTKNPDAAPNEETGIQANPSGKVLAIQRSRYGSNTFGARIDLADTLRLGNAMRYLHVMVLRPQGETSGMMVIGLGKRRDWEGQSPETEQFWVASSGSITAGQWTDLVFPISTNEYVDIHSIVIVPDLSSPPMRTSDFVTYIDDILVDNSSKTRIATSFYPVNFDAEAAPSRTDRALRSITISTPGMPSQSITVDNSKVYNNQVETKTINAAPGNSLTVKMSYSGSWMSGYAYVDWDNDGQFKSAIENHAAASGNELVSYTYLDGYDSTGASKSNGNSVSNGTITCPAFKIPADTPFGIYRLRLKVDWNCDDAGGNTDPSNLLLNNGGAVVDVLLNVHDENVDISANQLNGDVLAADLSALSDKRIPFGEDCTVKAVPAPGFTYTGIVLTHGYNLDGPQYVHGNRQFDVDTISAELFNADDEYVIAGGKVNGEVRIEGLFTPGIGDGISQLRDDEQVLGLYSIDGRRLTRVPERGVYIVRTYQPKTKSTTMHKVLSNGR